MKANDRCEDQNSNRRDDALVAAGTSSENNIIEQQKLLTESDSNKRKGMISSSPNNSQQDFPTLHNLIDDTSLRRDGAMVMGGTSGSASKITSVLQEEYSDPGAISRAGTETLTSSVGNIVINAEVTKGEEVKAEGAIGSITSFFSKNTTEEQSPKMIINSKSISSRRPMDAQVKQQHYENKRRFQGRPSNRESKHYTLNPEPCRGKYLITKIRSWRTGYARILSLHFTYFTTLDPDTHEITNLWTFDQVKHCMALPKEADCILIDVTDDKLKFKCWGEFGRRYSITNFLECKYMNDLAKKKSGNFSMQNNFQQGVLQNHLFRQCQRLTRYGTRVSVAIMCAPHGFIEMDPGTGEEIRTYLYRCIKAISLTSDDPNGVSFYLEETNNNFGVSMDLNCVQKVWFIAGGSGRSDLVSNLKNRMQLLCFPFVLSESVSVQSLLAGKRQRSHFSLVGKFIGVHNVIKLGGRKKDKPEYAQKNLVLTEKGFLLEMNHDKKGYDNEDLVNLVSSCRSLDDVVHIVRLSSSGTEVNFMVEFKGGLCRAYSSHDDAVIVSILDAAVYMRRNFNVTVTDVLSIGYRHHPFENENLSQSNNSNVMPAPTNLLLSEPVEVHRLKKLCHVATITDSYIAFHYQKTNATTGTKFLAEFLADCLPLVEICREFNANIPIRSICKLPNDENLLLGSIASLWGAISVLLSFIKEGLHDAVPETNQTTKHVADDPSIGSIRSAMLSILQTLYRLMMTPVGYSKISGIEETKNVFLEIWHVEDELTLYWCLKCLSVLLLPRPFAEREREKEAEILNKRLFLGGTSNIITKLVDCMLGKHVSDHDMGQTSYPSDLIMMVASNTIESVLCSHQDSTCPQQFTRFITVLSDRYIDLMILLSSKTSVVTENAALLLRIVTVQLPKMALTVVDSSLTSGMLLHHFYKAIFSPMEGQRFLSRHLCSMWMSGPEQHGGTQLLKKMIPQGFFSYLSMPRLSKEEEAQLDDIERGRIETIVDLSEYSGGGSGAIGTNINRLRTRVIMAEGLLSEGCDKRNSENFRIFFHVLTQDHSLPDLVWNPNTRKDLEVALKAELKSIDKEVGEHGIARIAWNHQQFTIIYPSLKDEVTVGSIYLRLWLQASDSFIKTWNEPVRLFELLFRRLICDINRNILVANMCILCLERLYSFHAAKIGIFPDVAILLTYVRTTRSTETRYRLLSLVSTLLGGGNDISLTDNAKRNSDQLLTSESIDTLCQLVSEIHLEKEEIEESDVTSNSFPSIWYIAPPGQVPPSKDSIEGPYRVCELKVFFVEQRVNRLSLVTTLPFNRVIRPDMNAATWSPLEKVWQLGRQLLDDNLVSNGFSHSQISLQALQCLLRLVRMHESVDSRGIAFFPIPIAKQLMCENTLNLSFSEESSKDSVVDFHSHALSTICQSLLSVNAHIVDTGAKLVRDLMRHNSESCKKLFSTGIFFFAFAYNQPNFYNLAELLHETHLEQDISCSENLSAEDNPMQSILVDMIPEGLLKVLINNGPKKFAEVLHGNYDTPEVIWCKEMREHLVSSVNKHLYDFRSRLREDINTKYEYSPIPLVSYFRLKKELFCHNYYLDNLCDEEKFPDWEVCEPQAVFRSCIEKWGSLASVSDFSDELNRRDTSGPCLKSSRLYPTWLLMRSQLLIIKRYASEIEEYKYPAYGLLLSCLHLPDKGKSFQALASLGRSKFLRTATHLVFATCLVSPLNAKELVHAGGVAVLENIFNSYVQVISSRKNNDKLLSTEMLAIHMESLIFVVHTFSGIVYFAEGRRAIEKLSNPLRFFFNWRKCTMPFPLGSGNMHGCNLLKRYALEGLTSLAKSSKLQNMLIESGHLWNLIHCMLEYDSKLELSALESERHEETISQSEMNYYGGVATRALGMLCGVMEGEFASALNVPVFDATKKLLTAPIANMLRSSQSGDILNTLNLQIETPIRLWDMGMRKELLNFVTTMQAEKFDTSSLTKQLDAANCFEFTNLSDEINIGGVYVRLFNKMDTKDATKEIPDCAHFARCLLRSIGRSIVTDGDSCGDTVDKKFITEVYYLNDGVTEAKTESYPISDDRFLMLVQAIDILSTAEGLIDDTICTPCAAGILIGMMRIPQTNKAFTLGTKIFRTMASKQSFANAIVLGGFVPHLLDALLCQSTSENCWMILELLVSFKSFSTTFINSSGWLELLAVISESPPFVMSFHAREGSARTLARLLFNPNVSTIVVDLLQRFIPGGLVRILKENGAHVMLSSFDEDSATPELIWNSAMRVQLKDAIANLLNTIFESDSKNDTRKKFYLPVDYRLEYNNLKHEVCIANVYVRLFLKDPSFHLRDPNGFFESLLFRWTQEMDIMSKQQFREITSVGIEMIELTTQSIVRLCNLQRLLREKLSLLGFLKGVIINLQKCTNMKITGSPLIGCIQIIHVSASEVLNVEAMSSTIDETKKRGVIDEIMKAIGGSPLHPECGLMVEALHKMFETALGELKSPCKKIDNPDTFATQQLVQSMAPSPAPTSNGSVSNLRKVMIDPLSALGGEETKKAPKKISRAVRPIESKERTHSSSVAAKGNKKQRPIHGFSPHMPQNVIEPNPKSSKHSQRIIPSHLQQNQHLRNPIFHSAPTTTFQSQEDRRMNSKGQHHQNHFQRGTPSLNDRRRLQGLRQDVVESQIYVEQGELLEKAAQQIMSTKDPQQQYNPHQFVHSHSNAAFPIPSDEIGQKVGSTKHFQSEATIEGFSAKQQRHAHFSRATSNSNLPQVPHPQFQHQQSASYSNPLFQHSAQTHQLFRGPEQFSYEGSQQIQQCQINSSANSARSEVLARSIPVESPPLAMHSLTGTKSIPNTSCITNTKFSGSAHPQIITEEKDLNEKELHPLIASPPQQPSTINIQAPFAITGARVDSENNGIQDSKIIDERMSLINGAPNAASCRSVLLESALKCELVEFLMTEVLENVTLEEVHNPGEVKVLVVKLLKLLKADPGYGMKFQLTLGEIHNWKKYENLDTS